MHRHLAANTDAARHAARRTQLQGETARLTARRQELDGQVAEQEGRLRHSECASERLNDESAKLEEQLKLSQKERQERRETRD